MKAKEIKSRVFESELNQFLNNIRIGGEEDENATASRRLDFEENVENSTPHRGDMKQKAQDRILQAEKFRAEIQAPKGKDHPVIYLYGE